MIGRPPVPAMTRFAQKYVIDGATGCWNWTAGRDRDGCGKFSPSRGSARAHKWRWEQDNGPVPAGLVLDHLCENRRCVNPAHLTPTTHAANILRSGVAAAAVNARRTHCTSGHPLSGDNLYVTAQGWRSCRACHRRWSREHRTKRAS